MKLFLDDRRLPPDHTWQRVYTPDQAIAVLKTGNVEEISFDHDLGLPEPENGHKVARWIEEQSFSGTFKPLKWHIHSANPVGRANIEATMRSAERMWC